MIYLIIKFCECVIITTGISIYYLSNYAVACVFRHECIYLSIANINNRLLNCSTVYWYEGFVSMLKEICRAPATLYKNQNKAKEDTEKENA